MRKLGLLLGTLVLGVLASAKEIEQAPPEILVEEPVKVIEKEIIVYRDREVDNSFRPNGELNLEYRYYGDTERQNKNSWNGYNNNYSRTQLEGIINTTESQKLEFRIRDYNNLNEDEIDRPNYTETRLRYYFDHGVLSESKINFTSRVHYMKNGNDNHDKQEIEYQARFNFVDYLFSNEYVKPVDLTIAPYYRYTWNQNNSSDYDNELGLYFNFQYGLPFGFGTQLEVDTFGFHFYGNDKYGNVIDEDGKYSDKNTDLAVKFYITQNTILYSNENLVLDFFVEAGYDPYTWTAKHEKETDATTYSLKADPQLRLFYNVTPEYQVYTLIGAEYRNWDITTESTAKNWRWQPFMALGFNMVF